VTYVDTSCLLRLFRPDAASAAVRGAVGAESVVIISTLTQLEALAQMKAAWKAGDITRPQWRRLAVELGLLRNQPPFEFRSLPSSLFQAALRQHRNSGVLHCRTLDRLHLAAMEELHLTRLMTHDDAQAAAAESLGYSIVKPGRS
jgi:predicted nucleic acid-binding protein